MQIIDLTGEWSFKTDPENIGIEQKFYEQDFYMNDTSEGSFTLPGSGCENKIGTPYTVPEAMTAESVRTLSPRYSYVGALWLTRVIKTEDLTDKSVTLFMERVNIASDVWLDGEKIGRRTIALSTPHTYDLSGLLTAGSHRLTIRIDNSDLLKLDKMSSGYSPDTQSFWLGIIGKIELRVEDIFKISSVRLFPAKKSVRVDLTLDTDCTGAYDRRDAEIILEAAAPDGTRLKARKYSTTLCVRRQIVHLEYDIAKNIEYWDEFNPKLYTMNVTYKCGDTVCERSESFGMRSIGVQKGRLMINDRRLYLRGTLDCAIYPLTGYPPTELDTWLEIMKTTKAYGLNHIRFHSWCPPENAFLAADMTGVYILAEMPLWLNKDVCALDAGSDPIHREYFTREAREISRTYGNHPSFIMFSNGNELLGDFEMLEDITVQTKALDDRRLYTLTTNFDHPVRGCEDFLCAARAYDGDIRLETMLDDAARSSTIDYEKTVKRVPVPVISFEVGQYCVYPNVDSIGDFTGNLVPTNFEVIKRSMIESGIYDKLQKYVYTSGRFAAMMYKEDIEASMRTPSMGGFELLSLSDYTGQCTATIGILDVFRKSKGIISAEEFSHFCGPVVPLWSSERIFKSTDNLKAALALYNASDEEIRRPEFKVTIENAGNIIYEENTKRTKLSIPLEDTANPSRLKITLAVDEFSNSWNVYVYPDAHTDIQVPVIKDISELERKIREGGKAIVTFENLKKPIRGSFNPVFWSPAWFPSELSCGMIIDDKHPIFKEFPTDDTTDFQWKHPIENSLGCDISGFGSDFKPILEPVPNFFDNTPRSPLFEARVGNADILFCGFDLADKDIVSSALKDAIAIYTASDEFSPSQRLDETAVIELFR